MIFRSAVRTRVVKEEKGNYLGRDKIAIETKSATKQHVGTELGRQAWLPIAMSRDV